MARWALLVLALWTAPVKALVGMVQFELQMRKEELVLTLSSQQTVFFPRVHVLGIKGTWLAVHPQAMVTQLQPDDRLILELPEGHRGNLHPAFAIRIEFQDKAGQHWVQFGTARRWPALSNPAKVQLIENRLWINPPAEDISTTWVLVPDSRHQRGHSDTHSGNQNRDPDPALVLRWAAGARSPGVASLQTADGPWLLIHESEASFEPSFRLQAVQVYDRPPPHMPPWVLASDQWAAAAGTAVAAAAITSLTLRRRRIAKEHAQTQESRHP